MGYTVKLVLDNGFEKKLAYFDEEEDTTAYLEGFRGGRGFVQGVLVDHISCLEALNLGYDLGKGSDAHYEGFTAGKDNEVGKLEVDVK